MKINSFIIGLISLCSCSHLVGQHHQVECIHEPDEEWAHQRAEIGNIEPESRSGNPSIHYVRVNVHYMLRTDGSGNFTEEDDNDGDSEYSGYVHATELIEACNSRQTWNQLMSIPANNTTPNDPKNYFYILDAVYFHRDNNTYTYQAITSSNYPTLGQKTDNVINVFLSNNLGSGNGSGYASSLSQTSKRKYTENRNMWHSYLDWKQNQYPKDWMWHGQATQIIHELGHLFGLSHTVRYNGGSLCPTSPNTICDDGCSDTPTAWDMFAATGQHPACGWNVQTAGVCTSNLMDYTGGNSLTPCQLNIIHHGLNNGMRSYTACDAVINDLSICNLAYPEVSYFGKNIEIGGCGSTITVEGEYKDIYFSESVEMQDIEIQEGTEFEVFALDACP
jgi:hypothetical protein